MKKEDLSLYLDQHADKLFAIAQDLYDNPEISKEEAISSEVFKRLLKENGFKIHEFEQEELKNAFYAEFGSGHPVVAMLGEYDALPGSTILSLMVVKHQILCQKKQLPGIM